MDTDHFDREYGEGLYENMCAELTEDIATAVIESHQFSRPLKQTVVQSAITASARRESLLQTLDTERKSIDSTRQQIEEIRTGLQAEPAPSDLTFGELFEYDHRLDQYEHRYEHVLRARQHDIHSERKQKSKFNTFFLQMYLYDCLPVDFPVLASVMDQYQRLQERRRMLHQEITNR